MAYIKYPVTAFSETLSRTDTRIFLSLLLHHFHFCGSRYDETFYITDRDLSKLTGCSTHSIWISKHHLRDSGLIEFAIGDKHRTYYTIMSHNGKPHK